MPRLRLPARVRTIGVLSVALALLAPAMAVADTATTRIIDVVQVTWSGAGTPKVTAASVMDVVQQDTISRWLQISGGRVTFTAGQVLPTVRTAAAMPCDANGSLAYIKAVGQAAYAATSITDTTHHYLIEVAANPPGGCVWDGRGIVGGLGPTSGALILKDNADPEVIAHELGHNLGLGHSNLETCSGGKADGAWSSCSAIEYGSATDLMGNVTRTSALSAYHQWRLGWIPDADVAVGNRTETVTLNSVDSQPGYTCWYGGETPTACPTFTRALFVRDKTAAYWVEFRHADPANGIKQGLVVYRTDPPPATSVQSPIASDATDPTSMHITTDVWMINLGDWSYPAMTGSPSLAAGIAFTTAFGGATIAARVNADGTATVSVVRSGSSAPGVPNWTDVSTWRNPSAPVTTSDLDDNGVDIAYFEAQLTSDTGSAIMRVTRSYAPALSRTYLTPVSAPAVALLGSLPEGHYTARLRAVNASGVAGGWSTPLAVQIDRGSPNVSNDVSLTSVRAGSAVGVAWSGARDAGSGICSAQVLNADGWARLGWHSAAAGAPRYLLPANGSASGEAQVFDCVGNGVTGSLALGTAFTRASALKRSGTWRVISVPAASAAVASAPRASGAASGASTTAIVSARTSALRCLTTCSVSLSTPAGTTALVMGAGRATLSVAGKRAFTVPFATSGKPRVVYVVKGTHRITLRGKGFVLVGAQSVRARWAQSGLLAGTVRMTDPSLTDPVQASLSQLGFTQSDFSDSQTVGPMIGGTGITDGTLDFCAANFPSESLRSARRQVIVTQPSNSYSFVSTETVRYSSSAATAQALQELDAAAALCQSRGYALGAAGDKQAYAFRNLPALPRGLRPAADRRIYLVTIGESTTATTLLIAYQFKGSVLNGMYVAKPGVWSIDDAAVSRWLDVAAVLAQRLNRGAARVEAQGAA